MFYFHGYFDLIKLILYAILYLLKRSSERIKNPHLRAKLAEALEALVPIKKGQELEMDKSPIAMVSRILCRH